MSGKETVRIHVYVLYSNQGLIVTLDVLLPPSQAPYTLLVSTFNPYEESNFHLDIYATSSIKFQELV